MGKKQVSFLRNQFYYRHFLDAQEQVAIFHGVLHRNASLPVFPVAKAAVGRRFHANFYRGVLLLDPLAL